MQGAVLSAVRVSSFMPVLRWLMYGSLCAKVRFPIEMKTNSDKCSIDLAAACEMLELKAIKNCSSSAAEDTLLELFPLLSDLRVLYWACMFCCTLKRHLLKLAAWLYITVVSLAYFSHLHNVSCEICRDAGGVEDKPECLAILL